jgi:hypothetical protein
MKAEIEKQALAYALSVFNQIHDAENALRKEATKTAEGYQGLPKAEIGWYLSLLPLLRFQLPPPPP